METGFTMESISHNEDESPRENNETSDNNEEESTISRLNHLKEALAKAIEDEAYEEASRITREINDIENRQTPDHE